MIAKSVPIPATVEIPVMIPVLPWTFWMFVTTSFNQSWLRYYDLRSNRHVKWIGVSKTGLATLITETDPFTMVAVPVAVVPIPTPTFLGDEYLTSTVAVV